MNHHSEGSTPGLLLKQHEISRKLEEMEPPEESSQEEVEQRWRRLYSRWLFPAVSTLCPEAEER